MVVVRIVVAFVVYYVKPGVVEGFVLYMVRLMSRIVVVDIMINPLIHAFFILLSVQCEHYLFDLLLEDFLHHCVLSHTVPCRW